MGVLNELSQKPWETQGAPSEDDWTGTFGMAAEKVGLRVFLVVVTILFSLMVVVYSDRMTFSDWRHIPVPWLLWVNTALLVLASVAFQRARDGARLARMEDVKTAMLIGGGLTIAFLVGQLIAWQQLAATGNFVSSGPAADFFYMLTAAHGLHMVGGLVAWGRSIARLRQGQEEPAAVFASVDLCTAYWHYLLMIWVVLFGLFLFT